MKSLFASLLLLGCLVSVRSSAAPATPEELLLKDYQPHSIYKINETRVEKARFPVIDMHTHVYANDPDQVARWVKVMDDVGLEKCVILAGSVGPRFDSHVKLYSAFPNRFELWCGLMLTNADNPNFSDAVIAELERCKKAGARGIGELSDKGRGLSSATPGLHCDDPRMDPIFEKCADLNLPINIHIGEDQWMYEPMDQHNDGLMNGWKWRIPKDPNVLGHPEVLATLKNMLKKHPRTTIIACHLANCCANIDELAAMLDQFPNLSADIGARFSEIAPIPRTMGRFFAKYQNRILYGTDNSFHPEMYRTSFRILESDDEHFYPGYFAKYHWPLHGFALPDDILKKIYRDNALKILTRK